MNTRWLIILLTLLPFLTACDKNLDDLTPADQYETLPSPPLGQGDCEYKKVGLTSEGFAQSEVARLAGIFRNSTLGSYEVPVRSAVVFPYKTKNGVAYQWGLHVVFGCGGAEIKFEEVRNFSSSQARDAALNARLQFLRQGRHTKVLDQKTDYWSWEECDTCYEEVCDTCEDEEGTYDCNCSEESYDCNCSTEYEYYYQVTYALVNPNNLKQAAFINNYEIYSASLARQNDGVRPGLSDSLAVAKKVLPGFTDSGKMVRDWSSLLNKSKTAAPKAKAKKPCPNRQTGKIIKFLKTNKSTMKLGRNPNFKRGAR